MLDIIKKSLFTGLGLACLTKEKMEEVARDIIETGNLSEKEGIEFVADLNKKSKDAKERLESQISRVVHDTLLKMDIATKGDVELLEKKIAELSAALKVKNSGE